MVPCPDGAVIVTDAGSSAVPVAEVSLVSTSVVTGEPGRARRCPPIELR